MKTKSKNISKKKKNYILWPMYLNFSYQKFNKQLLIKIKKPPWP